MEKTVDHRRTAPQDPAELARTEGSYAREPQLDDLVRLARALNAPTFCMC